MLLTRTIRRKLMLGLLLVLLMLLAVSVSSVLSLLSYRQLVDELDFSIHRAPRRAELSDAVGRLFEPLLLPEPRNIADNTQMSAQFARYQQSEFQNRLEQSRQRISEFHRKLDALPDVPETAGARTVTQGRLAAVYQHLTHLQTLERSLDNPRTRQTTVRKMLYELDQMQSLVQPIPDYRDGLQATLSHARAEYRGHLRFIGWTSAVVVGLFIGLMRYGYVVIFSPLRKLHQGASRVAQGDFDYRLQPTGHDEMAELAESFNRMTARFQEIAADLDRQVDERSRQLVRSERLAGIGFLAAGVAHEINNPLSAIAMAAESLEARAIEHAAAINGGDETTDNAQTEVSRQYLDLIQREAFRCQEITARLLDFSRGQENAVRSRCDLTEIIREVISLVEHMSNYRDRTITFERNDSCFVSAVGPEIRQVILNLVANAMESMDPGGRLDIEIAQQTDQVTITFRDTGCGMTPNVLENLFEPFFTRRRDGKGTGLGMSISHRIIADHGGTLEATSDGPGWGSTFRIRLPRWSAGAEAA